MILEYGRRVKLTQHPGPAGQRQNRAWRILTCCFQGDRQNYLEARERGKALAVVDWRSVLGSVAAVKEEASDDCPATQARKADPVGLNRD